MAVPVSARVSAVLHRVELAWRMHRWWLRPSGHRLYRELIAAAPPRPTGTRPVVVFDFSDSRIDGPQGRRFYSLLIYFVRAGFEPAFTPRYLFLATMNATTKRLTRLETHSIVENPEDVPPGYVLVTDRPGSAPLPAGCSKRIVLDFRPDFAVDREGFPMPFPMFPRIYADGADLGADALRTTRRQWRVYFGGDALPGKYAKGSVETIYNKIQRGTVLEILRRRLPAGSWTECDSRAGFDALCDRDWPGLMIANTSRFQIPASEWLGTMSRAAFFLACPGARYPMSHNIVEALSVGTVPITQYPEHFFPALTDGVDCLAFHDEPSLVAVVERAMAMGPDEVERLSQGAQRYFDRYIEPGAVITALLAQPGSQVSLRLLPFLRPGGGFA